MSFFNKEYAFNNEKIGVLFFSESRWNVFRRLAGTHVRIFFVPALPGAKSYQLDVELAQKVAGTDSALEAMAVIRAAQA